MLMLRAQVQEVLDEVYENFARFSMYLFNAIKGWQFLFGKLKHKKTKFRN